MDKLAIMAQPPVPHVVFGWFNLSWPDIAFWIAVVVVFAVFAWARIPLVMDEDTESRRKAEDS